MVSACPHHSSLDGHLPGFLQSNSPRPLCPTFLGGQAFTLHLGFSAQQGSCLCPSPKKCSILFYLISDDTVLRT